MSLQLFISHRGKCLQVDVNTISSPDTLRAWIAENAQIPVHRQILMTDRGKNVKQQHLLAHAEIFVYDKKLLSDDPILAFDAKSPPKTRTLREPPSTLDNETSLAAWQELFMARRSWALEAADTAKIVIEDTQGYVDECEVVERSTAVALENLRSHLVGLQQSFGKTENWAKESLADQAEVLKDWRTSAEMLSELPVREEIARLLTGHTNHGNATGTMYNLLDPQGLDEASGNLQQASKHFKDQLEVLHSRVQHQIERSERVLGLANTTWPNVDTVGLLQEAETIAKKISADYEEVLRSPNDTKSIARVSRLAAVHTNNLLPGLQELFAECSLMLDNSIAHSKLLYRNCSDALRQISTIQSELAGLQSQVSSLAINDTGKRALESLDKIYRLPYVYGSTLVEAIRRSEWNERMRTDLDSLREDISQRKDDEARRRQKWVASVDGFLNNEYHTSDALVDLSFSTPANSWPFVSRDEIFAFIDDLRALRIDEAVEQITQLLRELDTVVKSRKARPKAFKNGSVYDLEQSAMLGKGDEVRTLQEEKTRLEDKLRNSDSRIRKLEDLLHRQSQMARPPSGNFTPATDFERQTSMSNPAVLRNSDSPSRRSSMSHRRLSNQNLEEKAMVQRIVTLEAQITKLQQEAHAERRSSTESRDKMQEAEMVKRDLMANLESQKQEFDDERQLIEDENHKLKVRLEEVEEELDRALGSRDHERMTQEQVLVNLRNELDKLRKASEDKINQLRQSKEGLQRDINTQRERAVNTERHLQQHRDDKSALQTQNLTVAGQLRDMKEQQRKLTNTLQATHSTLSPGSSAPGDIEKLANAIDVLSEGATYHARGLEDALQLATAENKTFEDRIAILEAQVVSLNEQLAQAHKAATDHEESIYQERTKLSTVREELANEQAELENLRQKFAAGETGSDALKARLVEAEKRVTDLMEARGDLEAQLHNLKNELHAAAIQEMETSSQEQKVRKHLESRKNKARDLSERLFQQNDRMVRLLENFGYSISRQDDGLLIQRASRVSASTILGDSSTPMKRTVSGSAPVQHYSEPSDLNTLYWTSDSDTVAEETKYRSFIASLTRLDLDATVELVTKRYKDIETLAKKYQKDSRGYREKSHRLQSEAHDKIAYRAFKENDLALFLPTRNQATRPWAAFNVGAPHYFLREQDSHKLQSRDWLLARISRVEERVVDLSRSLTGGGIRDRISINTEVSDGASARSVDDDNPFELSDGLRWYMIDASEEKAGAPTTPGLGKSTVAASVVDVKGHMGRKGVSGKESIAGSGSAVNAAKTLSKSLDSRRSSEASRKGGIGVLKPSTSNNNIVPTGSAVHAPTVIAGTDGEAEGHISSGGPIPTIDTDGVSGQAREDASLFEVDGRPLVLRTRSSGLGASEQARSSQSSPAKSRGQSPIKAPAPPIPSPMKPKPKAWDRLFSVEFNA